MSSYNLIDNQTVTQPITLPPIPAVKPWGPTNPNSPPLEQAFQFVVTGVGAVSATAQVYVSNDEVNWTPYGDAITAAGTNVGQQVQGGTQPWKHFGAYLTAISGTGATASLKMSA